MQIATVAWKLWVRRMLDRPGRSRAWLAREIKATTAAITQLLGREDEEPIESTTRFIPVIHKALGAKPPPKLGAPDEMGDPLKDRLLERWPELTARERSVIEALLGETR